MKSIPRFKTGGIYASITGKKFFRVIRRTDKTVWIEKVDEPRFSDPDVQSNWRVISQEMELRIRTMDEPSKFEYTLLPKAYIKATNKVS
jgi:hypothetical protein